MNQTKDPALYCTCGKRYYGRFRDLHMCSRCYMTANDIPDYPSKLKDKKEYYKEYYRRNRDKILAKAREYSYCKHIPSNPDDTIN